MRRYIIGGLAAVLMAAGLMVSGLIGWAPKASAGCINAQLLLFPTAQKCDDPVQPDGTWKRCVVYYAPPGDPAAQYDCHKMGPGIDTIAHPFYAPGTHIDD